MIRARFDAVDRNVRGQATLVSLAAALVVLTAAVGVALTLADGALVGAERDARERRAAVAVTERLVAPDAPTTRRANVLDAGAVAALTATDLDDLAPPVKGVAVRVRLDDETIVERGEPSDGTTFRRIVLVASPTERSLTANASEGVTLPRRTARVSLSFGDATVETVRVNGRVVLHRPDGLRGTLPVTVRRGWTVRLTFDANATGTVEVTYVPERTRKAILAVTVDA